MRSSKLATAVAALLIVCSHELTMANTPEFDAQQRGKVPPSAVLDAVRKHPPATRPVPAASPADTPAAPPAIDINIERWRTAYDFAQQSAAHLEGRTGIEFMLDATAEAIAQSKALRERLRQARLEQERLAAEGRPPCEPNVPAGPATQPALDTDEQIPAVTTPQPAANAPASAGLVDPITVPMVEPTPAHAADAMPNSVSTTEPTPEPVAALLVANPEQPAHDEMSTLLGELRDAHTRYTLAIDRLIAYLERRPPVPPAAER